MASVDVVIPSYQYGRYLRACMRSALDQDGVDVRVLVIDNASRDNSVAIARAMAHEDARVEVVARTRNLGPHASFNEGIDRARADYLAILCADDLLTPGALARSAAIMDEHPEVHMTYGRTRFVDSDFEALSSADEGIAWSFRVVGGKDFIRSFCGTGRSPVGGPTAVVRTCMQKRAGHYRGELAHTDDVEMWMRFGSLGSVAEIDAVQLHARLHGSNQSSAVLDVHRWNVEMERAFSAFFSGMGATLEEAPRLRRMAMRSLADRAYWSALASAMRGEGRLSLDLARFALRLSPFSALMPPFGHLLRRANALDRVKGLLGLRRNPLAAP